MYWMLSKLKYRNAKFIHRQHLTKEQQVRTVIIELEKFITEKCLNRQEWWNCILNTCLQYIEEKKKTKHQPKGKDFTWPEYGTRNQAGNT